MPYLSAIDLLLNCGGDSASILKSRTDPMKTFLVTGGAGFIGSNFVHHLYTSIPTTGSWCSIC